MKKFVIFSFLAIVTFCIMIVMFIPASVLWRYAEPVATSKIPDLQVTGMKGSVWSGQTDLYYRQFPSSELAWKLSPLAGLKHVPNPSVDIDLQLSGEGHSFEGSGSASQIEMVVSSLKGHVDAIYINRVSQPQGLTFVGRVDVKQLSLVSDLKWIQAASGEIYWPGGKIVSRTSAAGTQVFDLPALVGEISMQGQNIKLTIRPDAGNQTLVDIVIKPDGWVVVAVKARLFDIAGLPWPAGSSPDDTVLQFEEKLLRGVQ